MIRKDQLPDIWGDDLKCTAPPHTMVVNPGKEPYKLVLHDKAYWNLFRLDPKHGYDLQPDHDNLQLVIKEGAEMELYRLQYMNSKEITTLDIIMEAGARLNLCTVTLNGGHVRNNITVRMKGEGCQLEANGLYLVDREQECDNYIFVEHACPHCISHELYKGIVDDTARARFNGHVLVQDGAVKTEAYMTNRNILLTDKAHVDTRPFLEIYNDDVKCSHGSTVGQLDKQALFYLRSRGITERTAMTMLSYAFCDEVIRCIAIDSLRDTVGDMVKKRLHGELSPLCDDCAIQCTTPCNGSEANFYIDPDKL